MTLGAIIGPLLILVIVALVYRREHVDSANISDWRALALAHGLQLSAGHHEKMARLSGKWSGLDVYVNTEHIGGIGAHDEYYRRNDQLVGETFGNDTNLRTVVRVRIPIALPAGFKLFPQNLLAELCKLVGEEDHEIDDAAFDRKFIIQGANLGEIRAFLANPRTRAVFLSLFERFPDIEFDDQHLRIRRLGVLSREKLTYILSGVTDHLNNLPGTPHPGAAALPHQPTAPAW